MSISWNQRERHTGIKGGKKELCDYLKETQATLIVTHAQASWRTKNINVVQDGFPFLGATATYKQVADVNMGNAVKVSSEMDNKVEIKRTLTGLKFTKVESTGKAKTSML